MVSICISAYNQWRMTQDCLDSIAEFTPEPHEVILINNGSTTNESEWEIQGAVDQFLRERENVGYPAAINRCLRVAKGDFLVTLNNDTTVTKGWLTAMLHHFEANPNLGVLGPRGDNVSGAQGRTEFKYYHKVQPAIRLVGFCMMFRRTVLDTIGGMDERFSPGNFDDDDFCLRALINGFELGIAPDSFVHHIGHATFRDRGDDVDALCRANWEKFKAKWGVPIDLSYGGVAEVNIDTTDLARYNFPL